MKLTWNPPKIRSRLARIESLADYSHDVHYGRARYDGSKMPARPWLETAIAQTDFTGAFIDEFKKTKSFDKAFDAIAMALFDNERSLLKEDIWIWDRVTYRQNNSVVSTPRNIFDLGGLYNSQQLVFIR